MVASNLKPQSVDEIVFGVERRLGNRIKVGFNFIQTKLNNSLEDAALDQAIHPLLHLAGQGGGGLPFDLERRPSVRLINPGRDVAVTLSDPLPGEANPRTVTLSAASLQYPRAQRTYRGVNLTFEREWDGKWSLNANYTYSKNYGNIEAASDRTMRSPTPV